ncbi:MAG TPA: hypothetical protein DHV51_02575 [Opitutae bacterium]|nr:hypothetical protein [Opitutae bacterium]
MVSNGVLIGLNGVVNSGLSGLAVYLYWGGALVVYSGLYLNVFQGLLCMALTGYFFDALLPVTSGQSLVLFAVGYGLLAAFRNVFQKCNFFQAACLAVVLNALLGIAQIFLLGQPHWHACGYWTRTVGDLIFSTLTIFPVALWFFELQSWFLKKASQ